MHINMSIWIAVWQHWAFSKTTVVVFFLRSINSLAISVCLKSNPKMFDYCSGLDENGPGAHIFECVGPRLVKLFRKEWDLPLGAGFEVSKSHIVLSYFFLSPPSTLLPLPLPSPLFPSASPDQPPPCGSNFKLSVTAPVPCLLAFCHTSRRWSQTLTVLNLKSKYTL